MQRVLSFSIQLMSIQPMRAKPMHRFLFLTLLPVFAQAHEGHGMAGASHYHATDAWGFVAFVFAVAVIWWFTGRGK